MKLIILFIFSLFIFSTSHLYSQVDTKFWFAAGYNTSNSNQHDRPINIWVSTLGKAATVTVSQPANSGFTAIEQYVPANSTKVFALTPQISQVQCTSTTGPENKGIYVTSTARITAYYEQNSVSNPDIFSLKGSNALGNEFFIPGQTQFNNDPSTNAQAHTFVIVAIYKNTEVTITPTYDLKGGHAANTPFTVTLDRGQTYVCQSTSSYASGNLAGSYVVTNGKPVAITINEDSMILSGTLQDLGGDQITPIRLTGKEYIVCRGYLNMDDRVYITGLEDNTSISKSGTAWQTVDRGETIVYRFDWSIPNIYFLGDKNFYVWHVSGFSGQPGAAIIPPIQCTGSDTVVFNRSEVASLTDANFALLVVTRNGHQGDFVVRGSTTILEASDFTVVPGTGDEWVSASRILGYNHIPFNTIIDIVNTSGAYFHVGVLNGNNSNSCRYAFFSNYASLNLGSDIESCSNSQTVLDAGPATSYLWSTGETTQTIEVINGEFWVEVEKDGCDFTLQDTIVVNDILQLPLVSISSLAPLCSGEIQTLDAGTGYETYEWMNNPLLNQRTYEITKSGEYWVKVSSDNLCENTDTINYMTLPKPAPNPIKFH